MRTWTLSYDAECEDDLMVGATSANPDMGLLTDGERVRVVELDPVLDLLERWTREAHDNGGPSWQLEKETDTLLREHEARLSSEREGRDG